MCQEIREVVNKLHKDNGMPVKVGKIVEKLLIKQMNIETQSNLRDSINNSSNLLNSENTSEKSINNSEDTNNSVNKMETLVRENISNINAKPTSNAYVSDILAASTQWTRILFQHIDHQYNAFIASNLYKILTKTTQPAHLISVAIVALVLYTIWPEIFGYGTKQKNIFITVIYLVAVATHFGALIWMTFFSGLALYFSLPRHTFGQCQHVLFPMYFTLNSILSILAFTSFIKIKSGQWTRPALTQAVVLALCAVTEVIVRLYLAPMLVSLMKVKYSFEKMNGVGKEVGYLEQKDLAKCPHYQSVNKRFRKIHMGAAISNITALVCSVLHIMYLAQKISIS